MMKCAMFKKDFFAVVIFERSGPFFGFFLVFSLPPQRSTSPFTYSETAAPRPTEVTLDAIGLGHTTPPFTYNQNI